MKRFGAIGLFDAGIGGLNIADSIYNRFPAENIIYYADTLNWPYGNKKPEKIISYSLKITDYLKSAQGCKLVIIACNTASTIAGKLAASTNEIPVLGTIEATVQETARKTKSKKVGLLATEGTIASEIYQKILWDTYQIKTVDVAGVELSPLAEKGDFKSENTYQTIQKYLEPLLKAQVDSIILGCTHYLYFQSIFEELKKPGMTIISPAKGMSQQVADLLEIYTLASPLPVTKRKIKFITSKESGISKNFLKNSKQVLSFKQMPFEEINIF